jgi:hypothetical protein
MLTKPAFTGQRTEFRRGLHDSYIAISIVLWSSEAAMRTQAVHRDRMLFGRISTAA